MLNGCKPKNTRAIYLQHTNGLHYVVLDVQGNRSGYSLEKNLLFKSPESVVHDTDNLNQCETTAPNTAENTFLENISTLWEKSKRKANQIF